MASWVTAFSLLGKRPLGDKLTVTVVRGDETMKLVDSYDRSV
ncbi:MAG: hypothetical protein ABI183_15985 [Polyangiaceae bacterium]